MGEAAEGDGFRVGALGSLGFWLARRKGNGSNNETIQESHFVAGPN